MLVVWIAMCESTLNVANPAIPLMGFTETKINNRTRKQLHSSLRAFSLVWSFTRTRVECHSHSRGVSLALACICDVALNLYRSSKPLSCARNTASNFKKHLADSVHKSMNLVAVLWKTEDTCRGQWR